LSTRSPKDGVATKRTEADSKENIVQRLTAKLDALKVHSGAEVIDLLTKSQRISNDLSLYFQYRVPGSASERMYLILREWIPNLPQPMNFVALFRTSG